MSVMFDKGQVVELRVPALRRRGWGGGWFDNHKLLAEAAMKLSAAGAKAVYVTLNPVNPALMARASNRVLEFYGDVPATNDNDIVCRRWLPVDIDPVRPTGISSTDAEHEAALALARELRAWLTCQGWPEPVLADSGNGAHLLYRIDLPNDDEATSTVKRCLEALSVRFSTDELSVDVAVFNAGRIWKCYGTTSRKGDDTTDRPHRKAAILETPDIQPVAPELLLRLADTITEPPPRAPQAHNSRRDFDVREWVRKSGLTTIREGAWNTTGYKWVLDVCPFNADHANLSAVILQHPSGAVGFTCRHNSCAGNDWHELRDLIEPGWLDPAPEQAPMPTTPPHTISKNGTHPPLEFAHGRVSANDIKSPAELAAVYAHYIRTLEEKKIRLGWDELDKQLRGIGPGEVMTVIAKSRAGKSAFLQNILLSLARQGTLGTLFCSMEQPNAQVFERYAQMTMDENGESIESGWRENPTMNQNAITEAVVAALGPYTLTCDIPGLKLEDIEQAVVLAKEKSPLPMALLALDYLGLIDGTNLDRSLYGQTSRIVREVKNIAKRHEVAVIMLCQVARSMGDDGSQKLTINSARESGAIEEAADFLLGLSRPNIGKGSADDHIVVQVLKNRKGEDGNDFKFSFERNTLVIGKKALADADYEPPPRQRKAYANNR